MFSMKLLYTFRRFVDGTIMFQALAPCGLGDFVCGRASEWVSNGTELCNAAGFSANPLDDPEESSCYGGKVSLDYIANSWKSPRSEIVRREQNTGVVQDFRQLIADMPLSERISWAVGGMVLTAGLLFARLALLYRNLFISSCVCLRVHGVSEIGASFSIHLTLVFDIFFLGLCHLVS